MFYTASTLNLFIYVFFYSCYFLGVDLDHISAEAEQMFETSMYISFLF